MSSEPERAVRALVREMRGRRLPGEREMAARFGLTRPRLRTILGGLRAEGLIEQRQGSGTFAVDDARPGLSSVTLRIDAALKLGDDPFFSLLLERLLAAFQREGVRCAVERVTGEEGASAEAVVTLGLAGAALLSRHRPADAPLVALLLGPDAAPRRRASVFGLRDHAAGAGAAEWLLDAGCREVVFLGRDGLPASDERRDGARAAAEAAGAAFRFVPATGLNYTAGLAAGKSLAPVGARSGLIAANDWLAVGLRAGLGPAATPPVVSFDGLAIARDPSLAIRSLAVPVEAIADDAVAEIARLGRSDGAVGRAVHYALDAPPA